ncbi:MAG: phage holin family protein [Lachnospiraceae bacterium]|nr:phage holin family protein [Lachnospiraceae bacterium]
MDYLELISVPAIVAVVYFVIEIIKKCVGENEKFNRYIPLIAALLGVVCGVICFFALPSIVPASNVVVAIVIGGASGLTATGTNQIIKQFGKKENDDEGKSN